jgi:Ca-activated chloride channel family protein
MRRYAHLLIGAAVAAAILAPLRAQENWVTLILTGKVALEDGSAPAKSVPIELICSDVNGGVIVATTNRKGEYVWRMQSDPMTVKRCYIHTSLAGYTSTQVDVSGWNGFHDPHVPTLVMAAQGTNSTIEVFRDARVPISALGSWNRSLKFVQLLDWPQAEREIRLALKASPKFAEGWNALGVVCENEHKAAEARDAYQHAIESDAKLLGAYVPLARTDIIAKDWEGAAKTAAALLKADPKGRYPEIYLYQAMARFKLKDLDAAEISAKEAIALDKRNEVPKAEYLLGIILEARHDGAGATEHLTKYLELDPKAANADLVRAHIPNIGKTGATPLDPETELAVADAPFAPAGETWIPGGMKALARIAHIEKTPSYQNFFADYCRAVVAEISTWTSKGFPDYIPKVRAYLGAMAELENLGERRGDSTLITLSLDGETQRANTERILPLLGWRLIQKGGALSVEPGDRAADGLLQEIPAAFGVDEVEMQKTLQAGRSVQFEIPSENARLIGGNAWVDLLKGIPVPPGGLPAAFTVDWRLIKAYAGLGSMDPNTAAAVVSSVGMRKLVTQYADLLAYYSEGFALTKGGVAVPGGVEAEPVWKKLTGADPHNPAAFFRALLDKQQGKLAAFYSAVARTDAAHQRFITKSPARAERFYAWYRDSDEFRNGVTRPARTWRATFFQDVPLDEAANVRFPGGRRAWTTSPATDDEAIVDLKSLEALVPVARLEEKRKAPLDEDTTKLLAQHYTEWRGAFPYFERLPGLGRDDFTAFAAFAGSVTAVAPARRNPVLGEWHSLVELIARGVEAGSLDAPAGARAFRRVCEGLQASDHSAKAWAALREITDDSTNLHQAVPDKLLRLNVQRRAGFDRVLELQNVPRVDPASGSPDPEKTLAALSGFVYAASLDPDGLLVNEDPLLLSKHQFLPPAVTGSLAGQGDKRPPLFSPATLVGSIASPGSYLSGGFVNFEHVASGLATGGKLANQPAPTLAARLEPEAGSSPLETASAPADLVFRTNASLVEVYTTVTDPRGRYVDDLAATQFSILEQGKSKDIQAFETRASAVSVALLLDTTGSMSAALPALKNAALRLIGELRTEDSVAVYSFNKSVSELQAFTTDKEAAMRAVLGTQPFGETALYDALARVSRDLSGRTGKKVIVLFTDGDDNSSTLTTNIAIQRAKAVGVPVFTIAQGEALGHPEYLKQLAEVSKATGGVSFVIREPNEIAGVFEKVSEDLMHGYMLTFQAPSVQDRAWRTIEVVLPGLKGHKVRAREGYYPQQ